jgi:multisubunit Na+/H+ antiporter MnhE subunit
MDEFSYLSVLLSVILGLAVTQILKGFRGLLLSRARIRLYWPVIAWAALLLLVCFQHWWATFGMRTRHDWTFLQFAMAHRGWFFSLGCGAVVVSIAKEFVLDHRLPNTTNLVFQLIFAATLLIGASTRSDATTKD